MNISKCFIYIIGVVLSMDVYAIENIIIARGSFTGNIKTNANFSLAEYLVAEVGRGDLSNILLQAAFQEKPDDFQFPNDAVLILQGPSFSSREEDSDSRLLIAPDASKSIFPYSDETWHLLLSKNDQELADTPEALRLPAENAIATIKARIFEIYTTPQHIYIYPPRRVPYSWAVGALCVRNGAVKKLRIRVSDTGKILDENPNRVPIKFFDSTEVTAEEMEKFVRDYHQNMPQDEWPRIDTYFDSSSKNK